MTMCNVNGMIWRISGRPNSILEMYVVRDDRAGWKNDGGVNPQRYAR